MTLSKNDTSDKRPLSPHLTVYKPQITSVLSISHRFTGVVLFGGALLLALWVIFSAYGCSDCVNPFLTSVYGKIFLFLWSAALYYHLSNGIRHLFWDIGRGFDIKTVTTSGLMVLASTAILLAITWYPVLKGGF